MKIFSLNYFEYCGFKLEYCLVIFSTVPNKLNFESTNSKFFFFRLSDVLFQVFPFRDLK